MVGVPVLRRKQSLRSEVTSMDLNEFHTWVPPFSSPELPCTSQAGLQGALVHAFPKGAPSGPLLFNLKLWYPIMEVL